MADERTEAQRRADEALDETVREVMAAYADPSEPPMLVAQWMVVVGSVGHDGRGGTSATSILLPYGGGATPWPQVIGLARCGLLRLERDYLHADDEET